MKIDLSTVDHGTVHPALVCYCTVGSGVCRWNVSGNDLFTLCKVKVWVAMHV